MYRLLFLVLVAMPLTAGAEDANYFLLTYEPGATWNEAIAYENQPGLKQHHAYIDQLHSDDLIVMGGVVPDINEHFLSMMLLRTGSMEEAEKIASQDPGVQGRIIRAHVIPWQVDKSSMRFVRRRPLPAIDDPDQKFSIKRVDPESRLNLDE